MFKIENLTKKYGEQVVLDNVNFSLPCCGFVFFYGKSGCGKSSLLHLLGLLDEDYQGNIYFNNQDLRKIKNKEKFRYNNIGFVFQNYSLLESFSVKDNININKDINPLTIKESIKNLALNVNLNKKVNLLSGGERQRIAISRALMHQKKVIILDEPTGALNQENKELIIKLLKKLANDYLIIIVSHEYQLVKEYADCIYKIERGKIIVEKEIEKEEISFKENKFDNRLSLKFIKKYVSTHLKEKKYRSLIARFSVSLGLVCIGFSLLISEMVGTSIKEDLISIMDERSLICTKDLEEAANEVTSLNKDVYYDIRLDYSQYINGIGTFYFFDFENLLNDDNSAIININNIEIPFSEYSARSINEFYHTSHFDIPLERNLTNNEIILGLRNNDIRRLNRMINVDSNEIIHLSNYVKNTHTYIAFHFQNDAWQYEDTIEFLIKDVVESEELILIHDNYHFNEYVFEKIMHFKSSFDLYGYDLVPWTMKKIYYLDVDKFKQVELTKLLIKDEYYKDFKINYIDKNNSYLTKNNELTGRIYLTKETNNYFNYFEVNQLKEKISSNVIYSFNSSYMVIDSLGLDSYVKATYLGINEEDIFKIIDEYSLSEININQEMVYLDNTNMIYGGLANLNNDGNLLYRNIDNKEVYGRLPYSYDEIVISSRIKEQFFPGKRDEEVMNKNIYFLTLRNSYLNKGTYVNDFAYAPLKIVGIIDNQESIIYSDEYFNLFFFVEHLGFSLSAFNFSSLKFISEKDYAQEEIELLNNAYQEYSFYNPSLMITSSINEVIKYVDYGLLIFASICIVSATLLTFLVIYLFIEENKKEIGLFKALGIDKRSLRKMFNYFSFSLGLSSLIYSLFTILINMFMISYMLRKNLSLIDFKMYFVVGIIMLITILVISYLSGLFATSASLKYDPIKVLKEK